MRCKNIVTALLLVILIYLFCASCQNKNDKFFDSIELDTEKVYLVFRGTNTKEGFFARDFNIKDTLSSHVGFTLFNTTTWNVFHVLENKNDTTDYNIESLDDFLNIKRNRKKAECS